MNGRNVILATGRQRAIIWPASTTTSLPLTPRFTAALLNPNLWQYLMLQEYKTNTLHYNLLENILDNPQTENQVFWDPHIFVRPPLPPTSFLAALVSVFLRFSFRKCTFKSVFLECICWVLLKWFFYFLKCLSRQCLSRQCLFFFKQVSFRKCIFKECNRVFR